MRQGCGVPGVRKMEDFGGVPEVLEGVSSGCWCQERWGIVQKETLS